MGDVCGGGGAADHGVMAETAREVKITQLLPNKGGEYDALSHTEKSKVWHNRFMQRKKNLVIIPAKQGVQRITSS